MAKAYSEYRKALWEAWRTFFVAASAIVVAQFSVGVNLRDWRNWLAPLLLSALAAGIKAVVKWAREVYGRANYERLIYKLPL